MVSFEAWMGIWNRLSEQLATLQTQIQMLVARVAELEHHDPPPWAKANRPKPPQPRPARKKRQQHFARRLEAPTETVTHAAAARPGGGAALRGGRVRWRRQVIDLPVAPVRGVEHVVMARRCKACGRESTPTLDLSEEVLGQHRVSLRLMGMIAILRLPIGLIQQYLQIVHGLHLSQGELVTILKTVATQAETAVGAVRAAIRQSPVVRADETGWRQNGHNGYVWSFSTERLRYFVFGNRSGRMVDEVLGADCQAVLVTDFYGAYDHYPGLHQRCWVHLLRDVHALREAHPDDAAVQTWATAIVDLYHRAKAMATTGPPAGLSMGQQAIWRRQCRRADEQALTRDCQPLLGRDVPQRGGARQALGRHPLASRHPGANPPLDPHRYLATPGQTPARGLDRPAPQPRRHSRLYPSGRAVNSELSRIFLSAILLCPQRVMLSLS